MCGRFSLNHDPKTIAEMFGVDNVLEFALSYNVAPSQQSPVLTKFEGERRLVALTWGLVPSWSKDRKHGQVNARVETVAEKPFFRSAFKSRRCLVPMSCWYEWQTIDGKKQPFCLKPEDSHPVAIAGIWEHWTDGVESLYSFALITRPADSACATIHDRMPLLVPENHYEEWLSNDLITPDKLNPLLQADPIMALGIYPVTRAMNSPKFNCQECIKPLTHYDK